jgi:hypothetical protein
VFNRPLFEERLRGCTTSCAWGAVLTTLGILGGVVGLIGAASLEASGPVTITVVGVFVVCLIVGIVMLVQASSRWRDAKNMLGFGRVRANSLTWREPMIAFDPKGWAHLSAEGGCVYCRETGPSTKQTIRKNIVSARAEKSRQTRHILFGVIGSLTVDGKDKKGREESGLSVSAAGVELSYRECELCRSAHPNLKWMWWAAAAGAALGIIGILLAGTEALGRASGAAGWAYVALIGVSFAAALGFLIGASSARSYGNPVQFAKADVNEGLLINLPEHLSLQAAGPAVPPPGLTMPGPLGPPR